MYYLCTVICKSIFIKLIDMADFYVNYGSKKAKLICYFKLGNVNIKIHDVGPRYVISKNRKIMAEYVALQDAIKYTSNLLEFEFSDFINF